MMGNWVYKLLNESWANGSPDPGRVCLEQRHLWDMFVHVVYVFVFAEFEAKRKKVG